MKKNGIAARFVPAALVCGALALFAGFCIVRHNGEEAGRAARSVPAEKKTTVPAENEAEPRVEFFGDGIPAESSEEKPENFGEDDFVFDSRSFSLKKRDDSAEPARSTPVFLENGDLYDIYGGGREYRPENSPADNRDNRVWIDARVPLEISDRLRLYGVSTLTLGDVSAATMTDYTRSYGIGGGFGLTYQISPDAELNFDFRRTRTLESAADKEKDPSTSSAGISLKLKF